MNTSQHQSRYINHENITDYLMALQSYSQVKDHLLNQEFKQRIFSQTIDQLKHEEKQIDTAMSKVKQTYSYSEIQNKDKYSNLCKVHSELFGASHSQNEDSFLNNTKQAHQSLAKSQIQFHDLLTHFELNKIQTNNKALQDSMSNIDKITEFINIPNILNQCLQQNQLVQATKLLRHYESKIQNEVSANLSFAQPQILILVDKEIKALKVKLIKTIYILLESSFAFKENARTTNELITLLKAVSEQKSSIQERLLMSRSKFIKDFVQKTVLKLHQQNIFNKQRSKSEVQILISEVLNPVLQYIKQNCKEFIEQKIDYEEWIVERLQEIRNLIKVFIKKASIKDLILINQEINNFNQQFESDYFLDCTDAIQTQIIAQKAQVQKQILDTFTQLLRQTISIDSTITIQDIEGKLESDLQNLVQQLNSVACLKRSFINSYTDQILKGLLSSFGKLLLKLSEENRLDQSYFSDSFDEICSGIKQTLASHIVEENAFASEIKTFNELIALNQ